MYIRACVYVCVRMCSWGFGNSMKSREQKDGRERTQEENPGRDACRRAAFRVCVCACVYVCVISEPRQILALSCSEAVLLNHAVEPDDPHGSDGGIRLQGGRRPTAGDPMAAERRQDAHRSGAYPGRQESTHRTGESPRSRHVHLPGRERRWHHISERHSYRAL